MSARSYLEPTPVIDADHPRVVEYAAQHTDPSATPTDQAISLYFAVRDDIRYDPYRLDLTVPGLKASATLDHGYGWCVSKAILLAACCRARGIPAQLGFADVRNHLSTARLRQTMKTDVFYWHGYTSLYLRDRWVKATPAFNRELCEKFQIGTLDFNGCDDSLYHPFDLTGQRHMEYLRDRGVFADLPLDEMREDFKRHYPMFVDPIDDDFDRDVAAETAG